MPSTFLPILLLTATLTACQSGSSANGPSGGSTQPESLTNTAQTQGVSQNQAAVVANDFLIIPGERVGPIKATTSEADLLRLLGPAVVTAGDTIYGAEGTELIGTTLYKDTSDEVQIIYTDEKRTAPETVLICPKLFDDEGLPIKNLPPTHWVTTDGLRIGTTLTELESRNGKPFKLWGFAWDYGGQVSNWQGGKLAQLSEKTFLSLTLGPPASRTPAQEKAYNELMGDSEFLSSNKAMKALNPTVVKLSGNF
ncbi:hypothetical protein [Spirosoma radiotolerans]|uniref:Uncharacterized protein n=1 Tax=Spirosoma radiotolerans TaxID=1379870 RepID=A0A0E3V6F5_9BACT|nr:hypothetical protein [Spirosoma radiotolerans]AKD54486.1 hypothetical protein SD10_05735 [Spirosoma radiotolerans]